MISCSRKKPDFVEIVTGAREIGRLARHESFLAYRDSMRQRDRGEKEGGVQINSETHLAVCKAEENGHHHPLKRDDTTSSSSLSSSLSCFFCTAPMLGYWVIKKWHSAGKVAIAISIIITKIELRASVAVTLKEVRAICTVGTTTVTRFSFQGKMPVLWQ